MREEKGEKDEEEREGGEEEREGNRDMKKEGVRRGRATQLLLLENKSVC